MDAIASKQRVSRWIDSTPTNIPHMLRIHRDFPDALFVHIIRDPRDVALSLDKQGWSRPLPWDKGKGLLAAGLYWEWIVRQGRYFGSTMPSHYIEAQYENLVATPHETLSVISKFIGSELDYESIRRSPIGSVKEPLTAFREDLQQGRFAPVGRWKEKFPADQLHEFESLIGSYMQELGYAPAASPNIRTSHRVRRVMYGAFYPLKQWAKLHTPLSRWTVNYSEILIDK
jgi:sulfotransferase family protein